jgi:tetratricopeptide (TPR) repeat protein/predicted Ser/Thr protein kinase/DNA polymerase III delta prime subunit
MGTVFLAHDTTLRRKVAIKILESPGSADVAHERLLHEARSASALNHPNICTVYEVAEAGGLAFIAMEYVEGRTLSEIVTGGRLPIEDAVRFGIEAADALAHAHDRGVIHRDLKAANAIVSSSGWLKLVDFGLAQRTDEPFADDTTRESRNSGMAAGTPYAMSPEQVRGLAADARTDVWALGVLLYEMLTGGRPFLGSTLGELASSILRDPPTPLPGTMNSPIHDIVHKCLAKDPGQRYQRAVDVRLVLEIVASGLRGRASSKVDPTEGIGEPVAPPPILDVGTGGPDFVGRESERGEAERVWARATKGRHQLLLLAGDPGIGKTRFAMEFARSRVADGATVLIGRCDEEALIPYQPFVEALTWYARVCPELELRAQLAAIGGGAELGPLVPELVRRLPDLPSPLPMSPDAERYRLFEAVTMLLARASASHPVLLVLDDLHWADKATLLMLRHIVRSSDHAAVCIVGTYRESELARTHPLSTVLADLRREQTVTRVSLHGLDEQHVNGLIASLVGGDTPRKLAVYVTERTDGNPFFVAETLRHLAETGVLAQLRQRPSAHIGELGLPEGVKEVIGRRLSRLTLECNSVLALASVVGREFDVAVLEALEEVPGNQLLDAIDEARRAQLVDEAPGRPDRFSFAHSLIRETLYGALTSSRRVRLHRRVGEVIERLAGGRANPPVADLAYHFVQAASSDTAEKAIAYSIRAGDRAAEALAHEEAVRFYAGALQALEFKPPGRETAAQRVDLHARRASAFAALALWAAQKLEIEQALQHLDPQQVERRCELLLELGSAWFFLLDTRVVEPLATEALELAERVYRTDLAANAIAWLARCQMATGDVGAAIETERKAIARGGGSETAEVAFAFGPLTLYLAGRTSEAVALARQAAEGSRSSRNTGLMMWGLPHLGLSLGSAGQYAEAAKVFDEVSQFGRKHGVLPLLARATAMSAGFHLSVFDFVGAEALQAEAHDLALSVAFAPTVVSASIDLVLTCVRRHDVGRAETLLPQAVSLVASTLGWHEWLWALRLKQSRAEVALERGSFDMAVREATEGIHMSRVRLRRKYEVLGLITRGHALDRLGRAREAIADVRDGVAIARRVEDPALLLHALDALLAFDGNDELAVEARALSDRIVVALPDETMRRRFTESEAVQRIRRASWASS